MLKPFFQKKFIEAGCDEAGRGCLAGPVFAAAVILPKNYKNELLNDSKKLSEANRNALRIIIEKEAIAFAVASLDNHEIDKYNILVSSFKAMHKAVKALSTKPELLLIDGNRFTAYPTIPHQCIIKGDALYMSIAAASVLAKTYRDEYMLKIAKEFPQYDWQQNKGYPTAYHRAMLGKYGLTKYHRKTFSWKETATLF
ncbi:MAG: Ribonuclease [Bacteroidota bacterium]